MTKNKNVGSDFDKCRLRETIKFSNLHRPKQLFVGDTNRLSCEPRGIPQKGLQIACVVTIYVNDIICKLA